jgi:hypothetical protein
MPLTKFTTIVAGILYILALAYRSFSMKNQAWCWSNLRIPTK